MKSFLKKLPDFIWHPFLFVLFALLSLLVANQQRLPVFQILRPLLIFFSLTALLLCLARWLAKDWQRAGLITTLLLLLFFSYGHVYGLLEGSSLFGLDIGRHRFLLSLYALLLMGGGFLILKDRRSPLRLTVWLNVITALLVLTQIGQLALAGYQAHRLNAQVQGDEDTISNEAIALPTDRSNTRPDIYYIILDTYTRQDAFKAVLDYDNSSFIEELRSRGFTIADCSLSNYTSTSASLISSLDMLYLNELDPPLGTGYRNLSFLDPYLQNNRVIDSLAHAGYTIVAFDSGYMPTELPGVDVYLTPVTGNVFTGGLTRYESLLLQSSAGILVYDFSSRLPSGMRYFLDATYVAHRQRILYELDKLGRLEELPTPKFVFAHILAPHTPFVFTRDGQPVVRNTPFTLNDDPELGDPSLYRQRFIDQTLFMNSQMLQLIDRILAQPGDPVIILQGDHGVPSSGIWATAILNAIRLPGGEYTLYTAETPVNTFRLIFNHLFNADLPLSPDRS
ncbi:MAG: hypothetical protein WCF08_10670, partial [Anaerolineaceae bacterium]